MLCLGIPWNSSWTVPWGEDPKTGALPWPHTLRSRCSCVPRSSCQAWLPPLFPGQPLHSPFPLVCPPVADPFPQSSPLSRLRSPMLLPSLSSIPDPILVNFPAEPSVPESNGLGKGKDPGWVLRRGSLFPHAEGGKHFPPLPLEEGDAAGWTRGQWSREHLPRAQQPVRMRPAVRGLCSARVPSVQSQLYKRINPVNNFSLPGALPALVSCSRSLSWALRAGSSRGSGDDISMEACGADPLERGEHRASASRGGGSCLRSDSLCLQRLRNSSGDESHSFFLAWFFRAFFKLSQLGRSVAAVSRFRIILSVIAF